MQSLIIFYRADSWQILGSGKSFCLDVWDNSTTCSYIFSFCKPLKGLQDSCNGGAVCQVDLKGSTIARQYKIGGYNSSINPFVRSLDG